MGCIINKKIIKKSNHSCVLLHTNGDKQYVIKIGKYVM